MADNFRITDQKIDDNSNVVSFDIMQGDTVIYSRSINFSRSATIQSIKELIASFSSEYIKSLGVSPEDLEGEINQVLPIEDHLPSKLLGDYYTLTAIKKDRFINKVAKILNIKL